jgi:glycosyltransferase involved in cell wall biosynthesis
MSPNPLHIALDATYSVGDTLSGVGLYSHEILLGLAAAHPEVRFDFCYRPHRYLRGRRTALPSNARRRVLSEPFGPRGTDLFHGLNQRLPHIPMRHAIATFHDLFVMTGVYSTPEFRARFTAQARDAAERADAVIAVSRFTASQVVSLLGVDPAKIHVVHHGIRHLAEPLAGRRPGGDPALPRDPAEAAWVTGEPGCAPPGREKVILNVGAIQKRKNIVRLVEAFETLPPPWQLVLAGSHGYGAEEILTRIENSPVRDRIRITGYVSAPDLAGWYARASVFAFPSLDEGFGMPVLEAMAAGVPVIASDRSALPEVVGDAAVLVDPDSSEALGTALRELTINVDWRRELARRGTARAQMFTWEKAVRETWDVYRAVLGQDPKGLLS